MPDRNIVELEDGLEEKIRRGKTLGIKIQKNVEVKHGNQQNSFSSSLSSPGVGGEGFEDSTNQPRTPRIRKGFHQEDGTPQKDKPFPSVGISVERPVEKRRRAPRNSFAPSLFMPPIDEDELALPPLPALPTDYTRTGFQREDSSQRREKAPPPLGLSIEPGVKPRRNPHDSFAPSLFSPVMASPLPYSPLEVSPTGFSPLEFTFSPMFPPTSFHRASLKPLPFSPTISTRKDSFINRTFRSSSVTLRNPSIRFSTVGPPSFHTLPSEEQVEQEQEPDPDAGRSSLETFILMTSLCAAVFLAALDTSIITTALPTISEFFHSSAGYTWVGTAYLLTDAASTPSWGKFSDIWGRKPILLLATGIFFIGSLMAGASVSIGMLIFARGVQGVGGGGLNILVSICISDLFSLRRRGTFFGIIGLVWAFASAMGPILGGMFTEKLTWRWCFYINLPITGLVFVSLAKFLHLESPKTPMGAGLRAVDWGGTLFIITATVLLLLGLEFGGVTYAWTSPQILCFLIFGVISGALFIINEWKFARYPVMPLRLFKARSNKASLLVCFCHGFVYISGTFYLPLYFQAVLGATPLMSGVFLLPFALSLSGVSALTGIYIKKTGDYLKAIYFGMIVMTIGFGLFIDLGASKNWIKIIVYQLIAGTGVGPNFQSPMLALQNMVESRDVATATSTFSFLRNLACPFGVVVGSVVFQSGMLGRYAELVKGLGVEVAEKLAGGSAAGSVDLVNALGDAQRIVAREAFAGSLKGMWAMYVGVLVLGCLCTLGIQRKELSDVHEVVKTGLVEEERARKEDLEMQQNFKEMMKAEKKTTPKKG